MNVAQRFRNVRFKCVCCHRWTIRRATMNTTRVALFPEYGKICIDCGNAEWIDYVSRRRLDDTREHAR